MDGLDKRTRICAIIDKYFSVSESNMVRAAIWGENGRDDFNRLAIIVAYERHTEKRLGDELFAELCELTGHSAEAAKLFAEERARLIREGNRAAHLTP